MTVGIAVIGAGLTGLTCANELAQSGYAPVVLDKGRGIGGRLATRRVGNGFQFDHGAQYLSAKSAEFAAFLEERTQNGALETWSGGSDKAHFVGVPAMRSLATSLVNGLEIRSAMEVSGIRINRNAVDVTVSGDLLSFDHVILTIPAPQVPPLIGTDHPLSKRVAGVAMTPNLTLMAGFAARDAGPFLTRRDPQADLAWIARDDSKPGRGDHACWVAQASLDWSIA
ncbi:MAG: FAD-dependent oxidoreductase, partial [Pseudomonadota bacterium]